MTELNLVHPDLLHEYFDELKGIVDNQLGHNYLTEDQFREAINPGGNYFTIVVFPDPTVDQDPPIRLYYSSMPNGPSGTTRGFTELKDSVIDVPVGVCIGGVFDKTHLASYLNISSREYPSELVEADVTGVIRTTAVRDRAQRNGVGTEMMKATSDLLDEQGVDTQIAVAWWGPDGVNIHKIMTRMGFTPYKEFSEYWFEESRMEGYNCPTCGGPPCECAAVLYTER